MGAAGADSGRMQAVNVLAAYSSLMEPRSFAKAFYRAGKQAAASVPWLSGDSSRVELADEPGRIGDAPMEEITESSAVNAVVFMAPQLALSPDMKSLYVIATVRVFANGAHGDAIFLDGGKLLAATKLVDTSPPLGNVGVEGIAASKNDDWGAIGARANMWFANGGARIGQAVEIIDRILAVKLHNFLTGHRGTANPYKA